MGLGLHDEDSQVEDESEAEKKKLRSNTDDDGIELKTIPVRVNDADYPEMNSQSKKPFFKTSHLKYAILGFNAIAGIFGLIVLSLSIWIRVDPEFWKYETTLNVENFYTVCYIFMFTAIVVILVAFLGCCGVVTENQWILSAYFAIFCVIFILELAAIILLWSASFSSSLSEQLGVQLVKQINERENDDSARFFMDFIQEKLECCGASKPENYKTEAPHSCRDPTSGSNYSEGCSRKMVKYVGSKAGVMGGVVLPILLLQLLAVIATGCLIKNIRRESSYVM